MTTPRVFVSGLFPPQVLAQFVDRFAASHNQTGQKLTGDEIVAATREANAEVVVVTGSDKIDAVLIERLPPSIRILCTLSVGTDHIDLKAAKERGLIVLNTPDVLTESVADIAILLMLGAARRAVEGIEMLRAGKWSGWAPGQLLGRDIWGSRLGIFGMGRIGRAIATRARGFGMSIHYHNRSRLTPDVELGATYHADPADLFRVSEVLCVACPATAETRNIVNAETLALLPKGAIVTNVSRGDTVDDAALIAALESGHVSSAGLDVFAGEPNINPAYMALPNVFGLPHLGSATVGTRVGMARILCDGLEDLMAGKIPGNRVV